MTDAEADALIARIDALGARAYREIGVPALLVAEDLTADGAARPAPPGADDERAALLRRMAAAIAIRRPDLDAATVAQLMEALADQCFLGTDTPFSRIAALHPPPAR